MSVPIILLPDHIPRCVGRSAGIFQDHAVLPAECIDCLRCTEPYSQWTPWIAPHDGEGPCPMRIGPREVEE